MSKHQSKEPREAVMIGVFVGLGLVVVRFVDMALLDDSGPQVGKDDLDLWII